MDILTKGLATSDEILRGYSSGAAPIVYGHTLIATSERVSGDSGKASGGLA